MLQCIAKHSFLTLPWASPRHDPGPGISKPVISQSLPFTPGIGQGKIWIIDRSVKVAPCFIHVYACLHSESQCFKTLKAWYLTFYSLEPVRTRQKLMKYIIYATSKINKVFLSGGTCSHCRNYPKSWMNTIAVASANLVYFSKFELVVACKTIKHVEVWAAV